MRGREAEYSPKAPPFAGARGASEHRLGRRRRIGLGASGASDGPEHRERPIGIEAPIFRAHGAGGPATGFARDAPGRPPTAGRIGAESGERVAVFHIPSAHWPKRNRAVVGPAAAWQIGSQGAEMTHRRDDEHVITRDLLRGGGMLHMVARCAPAMRLLTDEQRAESLRRTLAARPADARCGVWLFAYGSLIWNPALRFTRRCFARVHGWHRRFCLSTIAGRGTPEAPGLVLGLDRGGACAGAAFHVAEEWVEEELTLLWQREMLSGSYAPRWVPLRASDGRLFGRGIAFTIARGGPFYAGALSEDEVVCRLATARGALGSSADYLFHTRDGLRSLGIRDPTVERLAARVAHARAKHPQSGAPS